MTDFQSIARHVDENLPAMAAQVIQAHLDLSDPANVRFLRHPDGREQHQTQWHQWGIISHTRQFLQHFDVDIPSCLREWRLWEAADSVLRQTIDGVTRWDLLRISILLHDIGKFAARTHDRDSFHFWRHERMSGEIIRAELDLVRFGLTPPQIEYIAETAEDHFVLGLVRKRARQRGEFNEEFTRTAEFATLCRDIRRDHPDDYVEIGLLFLGDSLAKMDPERGPQRAVVQHPVNIAVARRYLEIVLGDSAL